MDYKCGDTKWDQLEYEDLLQCEPYSLGTEEKRKVLAPMLSRLTDYHRQHCKPYDKMCNLLGDREGSVRALEQIPMLPVSLFKSVNISSISENEEFQIMTSSGTTGQKTSKVMLDCNTAKRQQQTLERIVSHFIGEKRMPMLIIDSPDVLRNRTRFSARGSGIIGFSIFSTKRFYALKEDMSLDLDSIHAFIEYAGNGPVLLFGFTYIIWQHFYRALLNLKMRLPLEQGFLVHGGGWKKLQNEAVSAEEFRRGLSQVCGIEHVREYYGMAEQTGCIYMECECGHLHVSSYSDILIRNMEDFSCCKNGTEGVIQVLTPICTSYAGHSILTEDKGVILGEDDCQCGRKGKYFRVTGRIPKAEVRGCSDTYSIEAGNGNIQTNMGNQTGNEKITLLAGNMIIEDTPDIPFSEEVICFLSTLSDRIRRMERSNADEEMKTLGFWLRRANLEQMRETYIRQGFEMERHLGLGQSFHIAPSNVPLMFVYSCAIGLLAGNTCRIRVSERRNTSVDSLCKVMNELLELPQFLPMKNRISIVSYDRGNRDITELFSKECDARIVWGGDQTIGQIREIPLKKTAVEVVFPDRDSICVLNSEAIMELDQTELELLANRFYNDTYSMDQNACSCPRIIFWDEPDMESGSKASKRFWNAVAASAERYRLSEIKVSRKYGTIWEDVWNGRAVKDIRWWKNRLYVVEVSQEYFSKNIEEMSTHGKAIGAQFGTFAEYHMRWKDEWAKAVNEKTQTLTYFGLEKENLIDAIKKQRRKGVNRIVPVGHALWMDPVWDGKDLIRILSRTIM